MSSGTRAANSAQPDGLGSTMAIVDASGNSSRSYQYDVYGEVTGGSGSLASEFDFAGQQTDATGLQYLRARYYDPETGTFLSREPLSANPGWREAAFAFAAGSPVNFYDPSGLRPLEVCEPNCGPSKYVDIPDPGCPNRDCTYKRISEVHGPSELREDIVSSLNISLNGPIVGPVGLCYEHLGKEYRQSTCVYQSEGDPSNMTVTERRSVFKTGVGAGFGPIAACPDWSSWEVHSEDWEVTKVLEQSFEQRQD